MKLFVGQFSQKKNRLSPQFAVQFLTNIDLLGNSDLIHFIRLALNIGRGKSSQTRQTGLY